MPKILTDAYKDATFFVPYTDDKSEGVYVRPQTETMRNRIRLKAHKEAGADESISGALFIKSFLEEAVVGWTGFVDVAGAEIPCTSEMKAQICECDPDFAAGLVSRVCHVARLGEVDDEKN